MEHTQNLAKEVAKVIAQTQVFGYAIFIVNGRWYKVIDETANIEVPVGYVPMIDTDLKYMTDQFADALGMGPLYDFDRIRPLEMEAGLQRLRGTRIAEAFNDDPFVDVDDHGAGQRQNDDNRRRRQGQQPPLQELVEPRRTDLEAELVVGRLRDRLGDTTRLGEQTEQA